jgi:2-C-methyl-D-erythritol 2,4-cyclodiphosphate synthase
MSFRIGSGIDFHQLGTGRAFWLGGVRIPYHKGAIGHSDADVLLHAICDALLGSLCLGDIGVHFPDTDLEYKDIDSKILLQKTLKLVQDKGYRVVNIDTTICLQDPRIADYIYEMRKVISSILLITVNDVSIKATTTEHLGFVGRGEGIIAYASTLVESPGLSE